VASLRERVEDLAEAIAAVFNKHAYGGLAPATYVTGWNIMPAHVLSTGAGSGLASGRCYFLPIVIHRTVSVDRIVCRPTTGQSGGTNPSTTLALFRSKASGMPDCSQLVASATVQPTGTSNVYGTISATLEPGQYWLALFYYAPSAPSTAPVFASVNNNIQTLAAPNSVNFASTVRGLYLTGLTALPSTSVADSSFAFSGSSDIPAMGLRVA